jgi:DNA-binding transcriptional LysR family regulator
VCPFSRRLQELHIAQPALSKTISRLEEDLGTPLFDRLGRQIRLNPFGKALQKKAQAALQLLEEARREIADLSGLEHGRIHLSLSNMEQLKETLRIFLAKFPEVSFHIVQSAMEDMEQLVNNNEVDFFLTAMPVKHPDIRQLPILNEEVYLAVPPGHSLAQRGSINLLEASDEPFVGYKEGYPYRRMNDEFCRRAGFEPKVVCEVEDPGSIADLVQSGFGIAFIGECKSSEELSLIKLRIDQPVCHRSFHIAWLENRYLSKAALAFREFLVQYFTETQKSNSKSAR